MRAPTFAAALDFAKGGELRRAIAEPDRRRLAQPEAHPGAPVLPMARRDDADGRSTSVDSDGNRERAGPERRRRLDERTIGAVPDHPVPVAAVPGKRRGAGCEHPKLVNGCHRPDAVRDPHADIRLAGEPKANRGRVQAAVAVRGEGRRRNLEVAERPVDHDSVAPAGLLARRGGGDSDAVAAVLDEMP
jgi:hypothetical protein